MVQVIKPGFLKEIQCQKCGAVLRYDGNDRYGRFQSRFNWAT